MCRSSVAALGDVDDMTTIPAARGKRRREMDEVIIQRITATEGGGMDHLVQVIARDLIQGSPNN